MPSADEPRRTRRIGVGLVALALLAIPPAGRAAAPDIEPILSSVGARVQQYFLRAQSLIAVETVWLQPIGVDFGASRESRPKRLVYELRLSWEPTEVGESPEANIVRKLLTVNGWPPRPNDEPGCMDPQPVSPEP